MYLFTHNKCVAPPVRAVLPMDRMCICCIDISYIHVCACMHISVCVYVCLLCSRVCACNCKCVRARVSLHACLTACTHACVCVKSHRLMCACLLMCLRVSVCMRECGYVCGCGCVSLVLIGGVYRHTCIHHRYGKLL